MIQAIFPISLKLILYSKQSTTEFLPIENKTTAVVPLHYNDKGYTVRWETEEYKYRGTLGFLTNSLHFCQLH